MVKNKKNSVTSLSSMFSKLDTLKKQEQKLERKEERYLYKKTLSGLSKTEKKEELGRYDRERKLEELKKARSEAIKKGISGQAEKISRGTERVIMSLGKLGKPKAKVPSYSAKKLVKGLAGEYGELSREVPKKEFEEPRSLFFKQAYEKARSNMLR